jgi:hypothetical protein
LTFFLGYPYKKNIFLFFYIIKKSRACKSQTVSEWLIAAFAENVGLHISLEYIDCKSLKRLAVRARRSGPEPDRGAGFGRVGEDARNPDKIVAQFFWGGKDTMFRSRSKRRHLHSSRERAGIVRAKRLEADKAVL